MGVLICIDSVVFEVWLIILNGVEWLKVYKFFSKIVWYYGLGDKSCFLDMWG